MQNYVDDIHSIAGVTKLYFRVCTYQLKYVIIVLLGASNPSFNVWYPIYLCFVVYFFHFEENYTSLIDLAASSSMYSYPHY